MKASISGIRDAYFGLGRADLNLFSYFYFEEVIIDFYPLRAYFCGYTDKLNKYVEIIIKVPFVAISKS